METSQPAVTKLGTIRQERFARALADPNTKTLTEAAERAGYAMTGSPPAGASRLASSSKMLARVAELREASSISGQSLFDRSKRIASRALSKAEKQEPDALEGIAIAAKGVEVSRAVLELTPLDNAEAGDHVPALTRALRLAWLNGWKAKERGTGESRAAAYSAATAPILP